MDKEALHRELEQQYGALGRKLPGFTPRPGQLAMIHEIGDVMADADFTPEGKASSRVAVVEAGTGVGKTRAYVLSGLALARRHKVKLLISTATVALQEQLMNKDLPELAGSADETFTYAMLKGRGRYACNIKLYRLAGGTQAALALDDDAQGMEAAPAASEAALYSDLAKQLAAGKWDGQKDSLKLPEERAWMRIAGDRNSCTSKDCRHFKECPYFSAKRAAAKADVLVANHDLVLSALQSDRSSLPGGDRAIYVFDEAHHLPAVALSHFASVTSLSDTRWTEALEKALSNAARALHYPAESLPGTLPMLRERLDDLERVLVSSLGAPALKDSSPSRFAHKAAASRVRMQGGSHPAQIEALWADLRTIAGGIDERLTEFASWLAERRAADPDSATVIGNHLIHIGPLGACRAFPATPSGRQLGQLRQFKQAPTA